MKQRRFTKQQLKWGLAVISHFIETDQFLVAWRDRTGVHLDTPAAIGLNGPHIQITVNELEPGKKS